LFREIHHLIHDRNEIRERGKCLKFLSQVKEDLKFFDPIAQGVQSIRALGLAIALRHHEHKIR